MPKGGDGLPTPKTVVYHPVTGVPEEFHDFLHKDSEEYKRLKQSKEAGTSDATDKLAAATLEADPPLVELEKEKPGKKKKPKPKEVIVTRATRQRKKAITSVEGLDLFGVKLADAAKAFGKKYACGASVVTNPSLKEQVDIQGDVQELVPELILDKFGKEHGIEAKNIVMIVDKERITYDEF